MSLLGWGARNVPADEKVALPAAIRVADKSPSLIGRCANVNCQSSWFQLFRNHARPIFEGGWTCSPECTEARLQPAVRRELGGAVEGQAAHRHRIPIGLLMHEKGWITSSQLRRAVESQKQYGALRLGEWLVKQGATEEDLVTRALSLQWSCPVLAVSNGLISSSVFLPELFVDAFGALAVPGPSGRSVYLGFEQNVDRALALALERVEGVRVECGVVPSSNFREGARLLRKQTLPGLQIADAANGLAAAHVFTKAIERARPIRSQLVRVHEWLWLRMICEPGAGSAPGSSRIRDVVCKVTPSRS
ncbi:MAG: hypothetical protein JST28_06590 [Acidobacteria bacterium]|nr:hypothetical protein [Acidobacteriota bacterium]